MVRQAQQNKVTKSPGKYSVEQTVLRDDNPLPAPELVEKYVSIDPEAFKWIMHHAEIEQQARIKSETTRLKGINRSMIIDFVIGMLVFLAILSSFGMVAYLASIGQDIGAIIASVAALISSYALASKVHK